MWFVQVKLLVATTTTTTTTTTNRIMCLLSVLVKPSVIYRAHNGIGFVARLMQTVVVSNNLSFSFHAKATKM